MDPSHEIHLDEIVEKYWNDIKSQEKIDKATMTIFYCAFVYHYVNYCNNVWG